MYCSTCGVAVTQGLSFCNYCGAKLGAGSLEDVSESSQLKPGLLVSAMVGLVPFGLVAIAVLIGIMKSVAAFDPPILLAITMLSFMLLLLIEGVLIGLLLKGRRVVKKPEDPRQMKEQTTRELVEAQVQMLQEPMPSVTEHTTRAFEPGYSKRKPN